MGYRHDTNHLTGQQQAIIRQRDEENERLRQESEKKKRIKELKTSIPSFLAVKEAALSVREIGRELQADQKEVLVALNELVHEQKVELIVIADSPMYKSV